jgi:predicted alpha/beta-hydrolase family hydrolase
VILRFETVNASGRAVEHQTSAVAYPADAPAAYATLVLAHGAGAPQQSAFMVDFARALATRGIDVLTFNFLYTEQGRRVPDRTELLDACYRAAVRAARDHFGRASVFIGGKSMGGRIATHLAAADDAQASGIKGVVLLGYPLHPPGKPDQLRAAHLRHIDVPVLFVQGERDPFGTPEELRPIIASMAAPVTLHVVENGDHSLAPSRARDAVAAAYRAIQAAIAAWIYRVAATSSTRRSNADTT